MTRREHDHSVSLTFDLSVEISAAPGAVFDFLADIQDHEPIPRDAHVRMVKHPPSQTRRGTRWDEHVRLFPGVWLTVASVATDVDAPTTLEMEFRGRWFDGDLTYTLQTSEGGTTLHHREVIRLKRPLGWFPGRVEHVLDRQLRQRLTDIKALVERGGSHSG